MERQAVNALPALPPSAKKRRFGGLGKSWDLYLLILPVLLLLFTFNYAPMYGVQIAFKNYSVTKGIFNSPFTKNHGFDYFLAFFKKRNFWILIKNTCTISIYSLVAGFPMPIILALLVNKLSSGRFKRITQTISYAPHFISTVVLVGIILIFTASDTGLVNIIRVAMGGTSMNFMAEPALFKHIYVWTDVWRSMGWGSIIYIAALTNISPELYESAKCDGATKFQTLLHIDLPSILPTIVILLILNSGSLMAVGFEKAYLMQNSLNMDASEIISTYVYKVGIINGMFSLSTAINLFNSVINCALLVSVNAIARKLGDTSLW